MRDMSSSLYVASECIINYRHLDMRVTAVKSRWQRFASASRSMCIGITSEINIVSYVKVYVVFRRLSLSLSVTESAF